MWSFTECSHLIPQLGAQDPSALPQGIVVEQSKMWGLCDGEHGSGEHSGPSEIRGKCVTVCLRLKERLFNVAPGVPSWGK